MYEKLRLRFQAKALVPLLQNSFNSATFNSCMWIIGPGHYWMRSCRHLKDYRFDFHTAGTFWEAPGDYRSFIFIYRLLNWISDQWGRTVCARTLSFNWKKERRRELRRTHNWLYLRVGLGFGGWCTLYHPDIAEPRLGSWECSYLVRTVKGKRPSVCDWKWFTMCTENTVLWEAVFIFLYRTRLF